MLSADDDQLAATAAHALVSMGAAEAASAVAHLRTSESPTLRRLAEGWSDSA